MSTNGIFNQMLSGYDITTDSKSGMLFLRSTSRLFLHVFIMVFFQRSCFLRWNLSAHIPWIAAFLREFGFFSSCS